MFHGEGAASVEHGITWSWPGEAFVLQVIFLAKAPVT
jgi:hypothetical protein